MSQIPALATRQERELTAEADAVWKKSLADIEAAKALPSGGMTDDRLDPFHDHIDEAASILTSWRHCSRRSTPPRSRSPPGWPACND
jgi:hypothetical protein